MRDRGVGVRGVGGRGGLYVGAWGRGGAEVARQGPVCAGCVWDEGGCGQRQEGECGDLRGV